MSKIISEVQYNSEVNSSVLPLGGVLEWASARLKAAENSVAVEGLIVRQLRPKVGSLTVLGKGISKIIYDQKRLQGIHRCY